MPESEADKALELEFLERQFRLAKTIISVKIGELHTTELEMRNICRALIACREPVNATPNADYPLVAICPCTETLTLDYKFCPNCGRPIQWGTSNA